MLTLPWHRADSDQNVCLSLSTTYPFITLLSAGIPTLTILLEGPTVQSISGIAWHREYQYSKARDEVMIWTPRESRDDASCQSKKAEDNATNSGRRLFQNVREDVVWRHVELMTLGIRTNCKGIPRNGGHIMERVLDSWKIKFCVGYSRERLRYRWNIIPKSLHWNTPPSPEIL